MNYNDTDDDDEVTIPTLKAPPRFSQRPTPLLPPKVYEKHTPPKYRFYIIGIIIVTVIVLSIIFIAKPLQSQVMYEHRIFNLSPIVLPNDPQVELAKSPESSASASASSKPAEKVIPKVIKKIDDKKPKNKDYGI